MKRNLFVILFLLLAGASYAQPPRIDSIVVIDPGLNDTIFLHGKFGLQMGKVFVDTSEMQVYMWTDSLIAAQLFPFFNNFHGGADYGTCGPVTVNANNLISNARVLSKGFIHTYYYFGIDSSIIRSTMSDRYWRYDFHSFFLNHKNITKLIVPFEGGGNSEYDFISRIATFNVGVPVIVSLDSNYYLPHTKGWYSPSFGGNSYAVDYQIEDVCSSPLDARMSYREFLTVKGANNHDLSLICFPNPASKELNISYSLSERGNARLILYDLEGRVIRESANDAEAGEHVMKWDMSLVASGSYVLGLVIGGETKFQIVKIIR